MGYIPVPVDMLLHLCYDTGYPPQQQPLMAQQNYPPAGSYPMGQQLPNQPVNTSAAAPPAYAAGKCRL